MGPTRHGDVNTLLAALLPAVREEIGDALLGVYLYGSGASGGYLPGVSDVDLLAVTSRDVDGAGLTRLEKMHAGIACAYPSWDDRVEVQYMSRAALETFRTDPSTIVAVSPGEPIHFREAGWQWTMNWYDVEESGVVLHGPPFSTFVREVSREEFVAAVRGMMPWWVAHAAVRARSPGAQAYVILTMCRTLYTCQSGIQASKEAAAVWAQTALPAWADVIGRAVAWRRGVRATVQPVGDIGLRRTVDFVRFVHGVVGLPPV